MLLHEWLTHAASHYIPIITGYTVQLMSLPQALIVFAQEVSNLIIDLAVLGAIIIADAVASRVQQVRARFAKITV